MPERYELGEIELVHCDLCGEIAFYFSLSSTSYMKFSRELDSHAYDLHLSENFFQIILLSASREQLSILSYEHGRLIDNIPS